MDLKDLVVIVPELLLLVIPGYISIKIKEKFGLEKKAESFDITLYSILYSFIIGIAFSAIKLLLGSLWASAVDFVEIEAIKHLCYLLLAVLLGYILVKSPQTKLGNRLRSMFNESLSPEPSVWVKAMKNKNGAWVTVYLENGLIYTGMLINYTTDPSDADKEILLSNYRLAVRNEKMPNTPADFCTVIEDHTNDPNAKVYLNHKVITAIQIHN